MKDVSVKNFMIPIDKYASVKVGSTLLNAIEAIDENHQKNNTNLEPCRAVLVIDDNNEVIGKIGHFAFFKALEPNYQELVLDKKKEYKGEGADDIETMIEKYHLWDESFSDTCKKVKNVKVEDSMTPITEYLKEDASLAEAMHKFILWDTLSLFVKGNNKIVGIVRLIDIYTELIKYIKVKCSN